MFKSSKSLKILDRQLRSHQERLKRPGRSELVAVDLKHVEADILSDAPAARWNLADGLSRLGTWYAIDGLVALGGGRAAGWGDIHRSWRYLALSSRIKVLAFGQGRVLGPFRWPKTLELEASECSLCLAYAMAFGCEADVRFFGDTVRILVRDRDVIPDSYWVHHRLEPFMVRLLGFSAREDPPRPDGRMPDLDPYQGIIDAWNQPSRLAGALRDACEFHCQRIEDESEEFAAEFRGPPFDLIPAEILAVYSVRQSLGLETPKIEHPLLRGLFVAPVGSPAQIQDELLNSVEAAL